MAQQRQGEQKQNETKEEFNIHDFKMEGEFVYEGIYHSRSSSAEMLDLVKTVRLDPGDVVVTSWPKSGTTWMQEIVCLIHSKGDTSIHEKPLHDRSPCLDFDEDEPCDVAMKRYLDMPRPRVMKSHLHYEHIRDVIGDKVKVINIIRNPKDALVSFYHFYRMTVDYNYFEGTWSDFFELYQMGKVHYGDWFDHVLSWWSVRHLPNVLVVTYEDMQKDPFGVVKKIVEHLEVALTDDVIQKIVDNTTFKKMKENPSTNHKDWAHQGIFFDYSRSEFMRKGKVGDWKNHFTVAQNEYMDQLIKTRLANTGLKLQFEI